MAKAILFGLLTILAFAAGQRITTIHLEGVQYFISRMNPYSPELNYFLAYQYCRSLGLQLASFETKEKAESMTTYLKNAGYGNYDFWTSGNRLGTGMFLWMSTGLPFNATFDFFENSADAIQTGLLDPIDHNSNTAPQRTARDSSSGAEKGCVILKQPTLKWMPEDCSAIKDFICEQTRCYYYNYGSIPVSSSQGRRISATTPQSSNQYSSYSSTTPIPVMMSTYATLVNKAQQSRGTKLDHVHNFELDDEHTENHIVQDETTENQEEEYHDANLNEHDQGSVTSNENEKATTNLHDSSIYDHFHQDSSSEQVNDDDESSEHNDANEEYALSSVESDDTVKHGNFATHSISEEQPVEVRIKQISQEIEKIASNENLHHHLHTNSPIINHDNDDIGRQSFLSLTDLIRTLRPNDKQIIPQIDSDYSNAMRVLSESSAPLHSDVQRKNKNVDPLQKQINPEA